MRIVDLDAEAKTVTGDDGSVTGYDVPYPYCQIEDAYMPSVAPVVDAARTLLAY